MWAFDLLELNGEDLRALPLERRKGELKTLPKRARSAWRSTPLNISRKFRND